MRVDINDQVARFLMHGDEAFSHGDTLGVGFRRHIDHAHVALLVDVGEFLLVRHVVAPFRSESVPWLLTHLLFVN